ncbi:hypothetical protein [Streptomyces sp. NPDC091268]|uniref:hypothetical protein n=1 Tax=Streptomyces sp. NPDC091268 TaxID=3365979 RepID=UPI00381CBADC
MTAAAADAVDAGTGPRPRRRAAWILAALLGAVLVVVPAVWQVSAYGTTRTGALRGGSGGRPVAALEIEAGSARVTVSPRGDQDVAYRAEVSWSLKAPTIEERWRGDTLKLTPHCPAEDSWVTSGLGCSVQLAVTVPANLPVKVTAGSGRVDISGLGGSVDADVASGAVNLTGLRGALRARVGSGTLRAAALTSPEADLRIGSGRAVADFVTPPDRVTGRVGEGRLALTVPEATRFRVESRVGWGRCDVAEELRDPASPRVLDLSVSAGRIAASYPGLTP